MFQCIVVVAVSEEKEEMKTIVRSSSESRLSGSIASMHPSSSSKLQVHRDDIRTIRDGEPKTATSTFT